MFPFSKFRKWYSGKFSDLAKVTQLVCIRAKIQSPAPLALKAMCHQLARLTSASLEWLKEYLLRESLFSDARTWCSRPGALSLWAEDQYLLSDQQQH